MPWMALMCHTKRTGPNRIWRTRTRQWKWQRRRERKKIIRSRRQYERTIASSLPSAQINPHHSFGAHKLTTEIKALPFFGFGFCKSTEDRCVVSFYTNTIKTPTHKLEVLFIFCSVYSFFLSGKKEEKKNTKPKHISQMPWSFHSTQHSLQLRGKNVLHRHLMATNSWTIIHVSNRRKKKEIDQKSLNNIEEHFNGELLKLTNFCYGFGSMLQVLFFFRSGSLFRFHFYSLLCVFIQRWWITKL